MGTDTLEAFHESLARHIEELQRCRHFPDNWMWHPDAVRQLKDIDAKLLEDILRVHSINILYRNRLVDLLRQLESALQTIASEMERGLVPKNMQEEQSRVINDILERVKVMLVIKTCRVEQKTGYLRLFSDVGTQALSNADQTLVADVPAIVEATRTVCGAPGFAALDAECGAYLDNSFTPRNGFQFIIFSHDFLEKEAKQNRWAAKFTGVVEPAKKRYEGTVRLPTPTLWTFEKRAGTTVITAYISKIAKFYTMHPGGFAGYRQESISILSKLKSRFGILQVSGYGEEYDLFELHELMGSGRTETRNLL